MAKKESLLLKLIGDAPLFRMIDFLLENKGMDFTKKDIANGAGISRATLFNYWDQVEKYGIVKVTRKFGKTKLYTINTNNLVTQRIIALEKALIMQAMEKNAKKIIVKAKV